MNMVTRGWEWVVILVFLGASWASAMGTTGMQLKSHAASPNFHPKLSRVVDEALSEDDLRLLHFQLPESSCASKALREEDPDAYSHCGCHAPECSNKNRSTGMRRVCNVEGLRRRDANISRLRKGFHNKGMASARAINVPRPLALL